MMRFFTVAVVLVVSVASVHPSSSEERGRRVEQVQPATRNVVDERPMPVFNDKVRRFRFRLEGTAVTAETAEEFMIQHQIRNEPAIIGAYADGKTNSLVVIGPAKAEDAIRVTLATWIVEQGGPPAPLKAQMRPLKFRRKELLREMAGLEVQFVEAAASKAKQLQARIEIFETELKLIERQIQIVHGYIERQRGAPIKTRTTTAAR